MKLPKRNIITDRIKFNLNKTYKQGSDLKPTGLWYSCYSSWYKYLIDNDWKGRLADYIYKLNIKNKTLTDINNKDINKLLVINNEKDFEQFEKKYLKPSAPVRRLGKRWINWRKVANDFGGIEICPYFSEKREIAWYYPWDVASGCIWNLNIVKNTELIYQKKNNKYVKI